jgi:hypothetical protein
VPANDVRALLAVQSIIRSLSIIFPAFIFDATPAAVVQTPVCPFV